MADQLAMVAALPIPETSTHRGGNQVRQVQKIRQAQAVQVQQVRHLIQVVQPHQTLLVKPVTQRLQI